MDLKNKIMALILFLAFWGVAAAICAIWGTITYLKDEKKHAIEQVVITHIAPLHLQTTGGTFNAKR